MNEHYYGGRGMRKLSRSELRKMKENMQKVPLVQEMSEKYHRKEIEHAESLLDTIDYSKEEKTIKVLKKEEPVGFFQKIKNYLFG